MSEKVKLLEISEPGYHEALTLRGRGNPYQAEDLRQALRQAVTLSPRPTLDLSGLQECDTVTLQLLLAADKTAAGEGKPMVWGKLPDCVTSLAQRLGIGLKPEVQVEV